MKRSIFVICVVLVGMVSISAQSDLRIKKTSRMNFPGMPAAITNPMTGEARDPGKMPDTIVLFKGPRMLSETRMEAGGKSTISSHLRQCDLKREISYTNKSKKYYATNFTAGSTQKSRPKGQPAPVSTGGKVTYSMTYTDTGERQQMFGYTARHVKTTMKMTPSPGSCNKQAMSMETDGWYIDLPQFSCPTMSAPEGPNGMSETGCRDEVVFDINGKPDNGFAVKETQTISTDGMSFTMIHEVTEISRTELDAALFEIPPGYTEDKSSQRANANNTAVADASSIPSPPTNVSAPPPGMSSAPPHSPDAAHAVLDKKPGMIRIGIAKPEVTLPGSKDDYTAPMQLSAAVRDTLRESLRADNVEAIFLQTDAPAAEAQQHQCDYIFYSKVIQKRGGGGMFGKMLAMGALSAVGGFIPGVGGIVASTVASIAMQTTMGKMSKAKDEFTFDYKVTDLSNAVLSQKVSKVKAKEDGEDVLTPQIKQASAAVLAETQKRRTP